MDFWDMAAAVLEEGDLLLGGVGVVLPGRVGNVDHLHANNI